MLRRLPRALPSFQAVWAVVWPRDGSTRSLERRRARAMVAAAVALAAVVLLTSFPVAEVLSQRSALSSTARQLSTVQSENETLARQAAALANTSTVEGLARHDFGFVRAGQRAYDILPGSGTSPGVSGPDHVPLNGPPVVPGSSRSQALMGIVAPVATAASSGKGARPGPAAGPPPPPRGYWGRVVRSLEFWN